MINALSSFLDRLSDFLAHRKGLLPLVGIAFVLLNFILQLVPSGWMGQSNFFLHLGIILAVLGLLLARAL
jgi:hypothetical protein